MTEHIQKPDAGHGPEGKDADLGKIGRGLSGVNWPALFRSWLPFFAGLVIAAAVVWGLTPSIVYSKKGQPFAFNHQVHADKAGMSCEDCHGFSSDGRFTGIPPTSQCLDCHTWSKRQNDDSEAETAFLKEFVTEDDELKKDLQWQVYSKQPDCVYFSHTAHVKLAKLECQACHGDHAKTSSLRVYYQNRLTGYSRDVDEKMKMNDCSNCHLKSGKPENNACFVCHK